jgi:hypothetical protein
LLENESTSFIEIMLVAEWIEQVIKVGRVGETTESISRNRGNLNKKKRDRWAPSDLSSERL